MWTRYYLILQYIMWLVVVSSTIAMLTSLTLSYSGITISAGESLPVSFAIHKDNFTLIAWCANSISNWCLVIHATFNRILYCMSPFWRPSILKNTKPKILFEIGFGKNKLIEYHVKLFNLAIRNEHDWSLFNKPGVSTVMRWYENSGVRFSPTITWQ